MLGKMKCKQCGMVIDADQALKNSGNIFCSEDCAQTFADRSEDKHGCCC